MGHLCLGVLSCWDFGFVLGFCREVWLLFCVCENGKRWDFSCVLGFVIGYVPFCFASCMVAEIFGLVKETRDFFVLCR